MTLAWRISGKHPHPVVMSVLACNFDFEVGEWVFAIFDNPTVEQLANYSHWVPLDELTPPPIIVTSKTSANPSTQP